MSYDIQKFTIDHSKTAAKIRKQKLKNLESNLTFEENKKLYRHYKNDLETVYDHNINDITKRGKCGSWHEHSNKFFLNLKKRGVQN